MQSLLQQRCVTPLQLSSFSLPSPELPEVNPPPSYVFPAAPSFGRILLHSTAPAHVRFRDEATKLALR